MGKSTKQVIVAKGVANLPSMGMAAVGLVHERLPDSHPNYATIGWIASRWAQFEHVLDSIIWQMAGLRPVVGACITSQMLGAINKFHAILSLAEHLGVSTILKNDIQKLMKRSREPGELRNRFVHDDWFVRADNGELAQLRMFDRDHKYFKIDPMSVETIEKLKYHINASIDEASRLKKLLPGWQKS